MVVGAGAGIVLHTTRRVQDDPVRLVGGCIDAHVTKAGDRRHTAVMTRLPMFPLGSVLFPGAILPLQVFEPRYRSLVGDVSASDNRFGVVLIERGSEVGGGDLRSNVGTVAELVRRGESEDGRILITAVGRERIRVEEWFEDDPYPIARTEPFPDTAPSKDLLPAIQRCVGARRRLVALAIEMGATGQLLDLRLPTEPIDATWALCAAAPIGSFDRQRLLEMVGPAERLAELERMLAAQTEDLHAALRRR